MSNKYMEELLDKAMDQVRSMTYDEFQTACEKYRVESEALDKYAQDLTNAIVEARD